MKKYVLFAAAALTLAACSNDENLNDGPVAIRLSSSLEVQTRATTDIQGTVFDANEKVDVFITEDAQTPTTTYPQPLVYTTGESGAMTPSVQPYFPSSGNGVNIYAYYPANAVTDMSATGVTFTVQADQSTDENYKSSDLMYGKPASNPVSRQTTAVKLGFTHLLSKVTINLKAGDGTPDLSNAEVSLMNIRLDASLTPSDGTVAEGTGNQDQTVTVMKNSTSGSAIIPIQTVANGEQLIKVHLNDGGDLYYTLDENATFKSGKVYTYDITVNLTGLTVESYIEDWAEEEGEGAYSGDDNGYATM